MIYSCARIDECSGGFFIYFFNSCVKALGLKNTIAVIFNSHVDVRQNTCFVFKGARNWLNALYLCYSHKGAFSAKKSHFLCVYVELLDEVWWCELCMQSKRTLNWEAVRSVRIWTLAMNWRCIYSWKCCAFLFLSLSFSLNRRYFIFQVWFVCSLLSSGTN